MNFSPMINAKLNIDNADNYNESKYEDDEDAISSMINRKKREQQVSIPRKFTRSNGPFSISAWSSRVEYINW